MAFQIKNFSSIVASMINVSRASQSKITDFSVGAVARTIMEGPAVEIEELYLQMFLGLQDAIPVAIYKAFDFDVVDALPSAGVLTINFPAAVTGVVIPIGTVFEVSAKSLKFQSLSATPVAVGATQVTIAVACATAGTIGNIAANEIAADISVDLLPPLATLSNPPFVTGKDAESEIERKTRFKSFILSISRGTVDALRYCAGTATTLDPQGRVQEYVTRVGVDEHAGRLDVYVCSSAGIPTAALLRQVQVSIDGYVDPDTGRRLNGYRPAGVAVTARAMQQRLVPIGLMVKTQSQAQQTSLLLSDIAEVVAGIIAGVSPGAVLRAEVITSGVLSLAGVMSCHLTNSDNIVCSQFEQLALGVITTQWVPNA